MDAIFQNVWEMSLFVIPVILVLALLSNKLGKRYGAKWRYLLWMVIAVRLCIPVQIDLPAPMMGMKMEVPSVQNGAREVLEAKNPEYLAQSDADKAQMEEFMETFSEADGYVLHVDLDAPDDHDFFDFFLAYPDVLWLIGVLLFLAWQGRKYSSFKKMLERNRRKVMDAAVLDTYYTLCKEMGLKKRPEIYFCGGLPSPLCVGFFHPAVYINSEEREENDLHLILKHELTHCKRKDLWLKGILMLARALHFFNPFVHWMAKLAEKDMELSCDLAVMENCDMQEREAYSMAILRTVKEANSKNMQMSTAFSGGKEELKARFENIFDMTAKKRGIALFTAAALLVCGGTAFVGCTAPEPKETPETKVVYGGYTERIVKDLYAAKLDYVGDASGVGKIFGLLPLPDGVTPNEEGMELFTDVTPYGVMRHLDWMPTGETAYEYEGESYMDARWSGIHGMIFLVLVDNANYFEYAFHQGTEGEKPEYNAVMIEVVSNRERMQRFFGDKDLRDFAKDEETFMNFVSAINRYYYEGIDTPEKIYELMELDDAAAQARMNDMLYGGKAADFSETGLEDSSMLYQMIHADSLLYEIVNEQGLTSSDPLNYINCDEYEELVKIGEPALREFLATFAEGRAGNGLEAYIMMFACQDILGQTKRADLPPTEWYQMYAALDSTLAANFAYDKLIYTPELEKENSMGIRDVDKWSIIRAGEDERIKAVYDAIESKYNAKGIMLSQETSIYAPYIHKIHEEGKRMQIFATIFEQDFVMTRTNQGYGFFERGGSLIPTRLDFEKQNGKWVLQEWTEAMDGSYYDDSIKEMCKGHFGLASKMMDGGNVHMLMWQNIIYYMNAHYSGMNIPVYFTSHTSETDIAKINKYIRAIPMFE
ncbi:M56 family metallopeptidase [Anaerotignum sp.]